MKTIKLILALASLSLAAGGLAFAADKPAESKPAACCAKATADGKTCTHECCAAAAKDGKACERCGGTNAKSS